MRVGLLWGEEAGDRRSFEKRRMMGMVEVLRSVAALKEAWVQDLAVEGLQEARESWRAVEVLLEVLGISRRLQEGWLRAVALVVRRKVREGQED